jgi:hypothetical protein
MANEDSVVRCFMDGTAWVFELEGDADGTELYPSKEAAIAKHRNCYDECGIAEVEVRFVRWVVPPKPYSEWRREEQPPSEPASENERQMEVARKVMKRRRNLLRALAKEASNMTDEELP